MVYLVHVICSSEVEQQRDLANSSKWDSSTSVYITTSSPYSLIINLRFQVHLLLDKDMKLSGKGV